MFSKVNKAGQTSGAPDAPRPAAKSGVPSIISADLRITGDLVCSGDVQIDGWVEGDIQSRNITIGEGATVQGALQAESVRICGLVNGEVRADSVVLEKTAKVTGDILHKSLAIEQGAFIEGMCRRSDPSPVKPASIAPSSPAIPAASNVGDAEKKAVTA
ncbi:polymer-forming cytoskeletal protein [Dongia sp.]|uniref:bactofilin family protein n=1 Tax=Dongia sp. TaxID=1977262 RepID=UPI0035B257C9